MSKNILVVFNPDRMLLIEILDKIEDSDHMTIKERILTGEYDGKYHNQKVTCDTTWWWA